ncbi:7690_t:CDS:2, partial [Acaulospora colombiana]
PTAEEIYARIAGDKEKGKLAMGEVYQPLVRARRLPSTIGSSALDLPMKIVDILNELVKDGQNGLVFENSDQLASHLQTLLRGFPDCEPLERLRLSFSEGATSPSSRPKRKWGTWNDNWDNKVKPLVMSEISQRSDAWLQGFADRHRLANMSD